jgi:putative RNA 2'-phosphotransferase
MSHQRTSKFLSLVLRHDPARIGIALDSAGWTDVAALLAKAGAHGVLITRPMLEEIVASSDKQRFALSADGTRIRANQGHSVSVELGLAPLPPPPRLYHGTVTAALSGIRVEGLTKRARHHVHLSAERDTATKVGSRRGAPVVLTIRADEMSAAGYKFYCSENGVWLTDQVPPEYIDLPPSHTPGPGSNDAARAERTTIATSTVAACDAGSYTTDAGAVVDLRDALARAVEGTCLYERAPQLVDTPRRAGVITVTTETTMEAIYRLAARPASHDGRGGPHLACLNFASARRAGGGFLQGALAQEEALARSSGLYPCLLTQPYFYERNRATASALYLDLTIFSPLVPFFRNDAGAWLAAPVLASVITAPAPNAGALRQQRDYRADTVRLTLLRRARIILSVAAAHDVTTLVLGAWGAGVFGNEPAMVAECFAEALAELRYAFDEIVFAVPAGPNHAPFASKFWLSRGKA